MSNIITHQPWCDRDEHGQDDDGLCVTRPLHVGADLSLWLERQSDGGIKVILDTNPRSGVGMPQGAQITPAQAKDLAADLVGLFAVAEKADPSPFVQHMPWCADHQSGQCCSEPTDVAPHAAVWLTQTEQGTRVIVDGPPSGLELTTDEALELRDAIHLQYERYEATQ